MPQDKVPDKTEAWSEKYLPIPLLLTDPANTKSFCEVMSLLLNVPTLEVSRLQTGKDAHPSETKIMCEPVAFYSQWRQRNVERLLDKLLVNIRHKLDYGITDAPYKHFPIQEPALRFAREHELAPELR